MFRLYCHTDGKCGKTCHSPTQIGLDSWRAAIGRLSWELWICGDSELHDGSLIENGAEWSDWESCCNLYYSLRWTDEKTSGCAKCQESWLKNSWGRRKLPNSLHSGLRNWNGPDFFSTNTNSKQPQNFGHCIQQYVLLHSA